MATDGGLNTDEVAEALKVARESGDEEQARYLQKVLDSRAERKAVVNAHEIVAGNPDAYPERTVEQQEQEAIGRPHEPISPEDLGVRGSVPAGDEPKKAAAKK
jgi:hypothetical protein